MSLPKQKLSLLGKRKSFYKYNRKELKIQFVTLEISANGAN